MKNETENLFGKPEEENRTGSVRLHFGTFAQAKEASVSGKRNNQRLRLSK
jgi:hypothetical protein